MIVRSRAERVLRHCRSRESGALNEAQVRAQLPALPDWSRGEGHIVRDYRFADYHETIAFVTALAFTVDREDHHPVPVVGYNGCAVRFKTQCVGGISENDFTCAARADAIFAQHFGHGAA